MLVLKTGSTSASPEAFLEAVEESLALPEVPIMKMFEETEGLLFPTSYHTGLLWALEGLAWIPQYLSRVTLILGQLTRLDPGGKLANRPSSSLRSIYLPWYPQTNASIDERLASLDILVKKEPESAWNLMLSLLPNHSDVANPTHKMRWRFAEDPKEVKVTYSEVWQNHSAITKKLLALAGNDEEKISQLLNEFTYLPIADHNEVFKYVEVNLDQIKQVKYALWHQIRKTLSHERSYPKKQRGFSDTEFARLEAIYEKISPQTAVDKNIWMFTEQWPAFPEGLDRKKLKYEVQEAEILKRRKAALLEIYGEVGIEGLKKLVSTAQEPAGAIFGYVGGHVLSQKDSEAFLTLLNSSDVLERNAAQNLVRAKAHLRGIEWVKKAFFLLQERKFTNEALALMLTSLVTTRELWDFVESCSAEVAELYWKNAHLHIGGLSPEDKVYGIQKLLSVKRFISATRTAYLYAEDLPSELLLEVLEKTATIKSEETLRLDGHEVERIFQVLDTRHNYDKSRLATLEWLYISVLSSYGSSRSVLLLHQELASNPEFFVQILKYVYKPKDEAKAEKELEGLGQEQILERAKHAYKLLNSWEIVPGVNQDNQIDEQALKQWVFKVRKLAVVCDRLDYADLFIGKILAAYPEGGEQWPPDLICEIIDTVNSRAMKIDFWIAVRNKRSFSSRSPYEGGNRERGLSQYFKDLSLKINYKWPVTASLLEKVSRDYEADARREDNQAEQDDLEF